jgi:hypothetical protein
VLLVLASLPLVTAASCVDSQNPLSDEKTSVIDERLIGTWLPKAEKSDALVVKRSDTQKNTLEGIGGKKADKTAADTLLLFTTTIQSKNYISIRRTEAQPDDSLKTPPKVSYDICQYHFLNNDTLEIRFMTPDVMEKAIKNAQLSGKIGDKEKAITASPEEIAKYLAVHADECYPKKSDYQLTFKRQK